MRASDKWTLTFAVAEEILSNTPKILSLRFSESIVTYEGPILYSRPRPVLPTMTTLINAVKRSG